MAIPSFVAFNWYPNNTCQLFYTFPTTYKIQSTPQARLYFPQRIFPTVNQCCMPDLTYLLDKLKNGTWNYVNVSTPRNLILDNHGYIVTVEMQPPKLDRFDRHNLTMISQTSITGLDLMAVGFVNNAYFAALINGPILIIDSGNLTVLNSIASPNIQGARSIMFLNNGSTMTITSIVTNKIVFFYQTNSSFPNYSFAYEQSTNYSSVHGLRRYNDTYFYATSWTNDAVYSYTAVPNSTLWTETLVIDASSFIGGSGGTFVTIDECGRFWFSLRTSVVEIFDNLGSWIGSFRLMNGWIIDTLITDNYVMYFSDGNPSGSRIIRIDPHIEC